MINIDDDPKEIVKQLTKTERNIFISWARWGFQSKNVNEHSLKKKLSNEDLKNYNQAFSNLCSCGIIVMYRPGNFGVSKQGRKITDEVVNQKRMDKYAGLRILMLQV